MVTNRLFILIYSLFLSTAIADVIPGRFILQVNETTRYSVGDEAFDFFKIIDRFSDHLVIQSSVPEIKTVDPEAVCLSLKEYHKDVLLCSPETISTIKNLPNDPFMGSLWGLKNSSGGPDIGAEAAWSLSTGSDDVIIAVIDTGIDFNHPDLVENLWINKQEIANNGVDDDRNGYIDDINGISSELGDGNPYDLDQHGTHVSGTIGARGNNSFGLTGVAWRVKILSVAGLGRRGFSTSALVKGIDYIVNLKQRGEKIVGLNASLGGSFPSEVEKAAFLRLRQNGILLIAAAGNEAQNNDSYPTFPSQYDPENTISVAAVNIEGRLAYFSNYGMSVDIAAPGQDILSTAPGGGYAVLPGTSMASPHVAGALAVLAAFRPGLPSAEYKKIILTSSRPLASLQGLIQGGRFLNIASMLQLARTLYPEAANAQPTVIPQPTPTILPTPEVASSASPTATAKPNATPQTTIAGALNLELKIPRAATNSLTKQSAKISISSESERQVTLELSVNGRSCPKEIQLTIPGDQRPINLSITIPFRRPLLTLNVSVYGSSGEFLDSAQREVKRAGAAKKPANPRSEICRAFSRLGMTSKG